ELGPKRLKISIRPAERACFIYLLHNVRRRVADGTDTHDPKLSFWRWKRPEAYCTVSTGVGGVERSDGARPAWLGVAMRSWALVVGSLSLTLCWSHSASAQNWPTRTVTVVVPLPAGTSVDSIARLVMQQVGQQVGQSFIVENRPGAGGTLGTNFVAK